MPERPLQHETEAALVVRANRGEQAALAELYLRHRDWAVALAWRFTGSQDDALDVMQSAFEALFKQFPGFELRSSLRGYLFPVIKNRCISLFRSRRKIVSLEAVRSGEHEPEALQGWHPEPDGDLQRLLAELPAEQAELVKLRFGLGFKLAEVAEAQGVALGTVKSRLHNALKKLRNFLEQEEK